MDREEIDLSEVIGERFTQGCGVLSLQLDMKDEDLLFAVKTALAYGKPFKVIPPTGFVFMDGKADAEQIPKMMAILAACGRDDAIIQADTNKDKVDLDVLAPCPCGATPKELGITDSGQGGKWALVSGDCCGEWHIEFRTEYSDLESDKCKSLARAAWNAAPRAARLPDGRQLHPWRGNIATPPCDGSLCALIKARKPGVETLSGFACVNVKADKDEICKNAKIKRQWISIQRYRFDESVNIAKGLYLPHLRGTWLPSFDWQSDCGLAVNWLGIRVRVSLGIYA